MNKGENTMEIKIEGWNDNQYEIRANLIQEVLLIMNKYFATDYLNDFPFLIQHVSCADAGCSKDFPCTHPDRSKICITVENADWLQFIYQASHELCHISTSRKSLPQTLKWFDEFICCLSSWIVFYHIKTKGNKLLSTLYQANISELVMDYMGKLLLYRYPDNTIAVKNTQEFFQLNYSSYIQDQNLIKKHDVYYLSLCHALSYNFTSLSFVGKLHMIKTHNEMTIEQYLTEAIKLCDTNERNAIKIICDIFGFNVNFNI